MVEIIPAILSKEFLDLKERMAVLSGSAPLVHVDVMDGTLTREASWPYGEEDSRSEEWEKITREEAGFPSWEEMNFEAHLMVKNPEAVYADWIRAGAERLIVHYEAFESDEACSDFLTTFIERFSGDNQSLKVEIGLAVDLGTPIEKIIDHVLESDFIHLMSVREIGSQGQPFEEDIFNKIAELYSSYPETIISVDGGISLENAKRLVEAGVERLCVGSAIWQTGSPVENLEDLLMEVE